MNGHDFNGCPVITKGTQVRVRTTNGGDIVATLLQHYRRTYDVVIASGNGYATISMWRVVSVEVA